MYQYSLVRPFLPKISKLWPIFEIDKIVGKCLYTLKASEKQKWAIASKF